MAAKTETDIEFPILGGLLDGLADSKTLEDLKGIERGRVNAPGDDGKNNKKEAPDKPVKDKKPVQQEEEPEEEEIEEEEPASKGKKSEKKDTKGEKEEDEEQEEEEDQPEDEPVLNNKFGIKIGGKKEEKKSSKLEIKSFDELPTLLKTKYGQEVKDPKALPKFFETVDKWRSDSQNLDKVTKEKDNAIAVFEQLPPELLDAVKMHYQGHDFRKAFEGNVKLDFSKPVDKHKPQSLVNAFFPGEFTDEDFEAEEVSRELKIAIKASEKEYNLEKNTREQRAKDHVNEAKRKSEAYKESVKGSVTALKSAFPDMAADVHADVEHVLSSGALMGEFFNPDGTYKPHAAKMFMLAKHGEELIEQLMQIAERRGESNANEEIVKRSPNKPKDKKGGSKESSVRKEVEDTVEKLLPQGLMNKRVF